jgi:chromosome segregation ATPase
MSETIEWLGGLEGKVREAAERLQTLRQENRKLVSQVRDLESRLSEAEARAAAAGTAPADGEWQQERAEIRRRVESLTATLEELIDEEIP